METPDLDPIATLLRDARVDVPDDGFSDRVLRALPAPAPSPRRSLRPAVLLCASILACLAGFAALPGGGWLAGTLSQVFRPDAWTTLPLAGAALIATVVGGVIAVTTGDGP